MCCRNRHHFAEAKFKKFGQLNAFEHAFALIGYQYTGFAELTQVFVDPPLESDIYHHRHHRDEEPDGVVCRLRAVHVVARDQDLHKGDPSVARI